MLNFNNLPEVKLAREMRPYVDVIYTSLFPYAEMERFEAAPGDKGLLDRNYGIDVQFRMPSGLLKTLSERIRQYYYYKRFQDFTLEYHQNPHTDPPEEGEFFHLDADYFFYCWANESRDGLAGYRLVDLPAFKCGVEEGTIVMNGPIKNDDKRGYRNFVSFNFKEIAKAGAIIKWVDKNNTKERRGS